jgi:hypothetical protein
MFAPATALSNVTICADQQVGWISETSLSWRPKALGA